MEHLLVRLGWSPCSHAHPSFRSFAHSVLVPSPCAWVSRRMYLRARSAHIHCYEMSHSRVWNCPSSYCKYGSAASVPLTDLCLSRACMLSQTSIPSTCRRANSTSGLWDSSFHPSYHLSPLVSSLRVRIGDGRMESGRYMVPLCVYSSHSSWRRRTCAYSSFFTCTYGTLRMYDRTIKPIPEAPLRGLKNRFNALIGITGMRMAKHRSSWTEAIISPLNCIWRPHLFAVLLFEGALFGFGIGLNVCTPFSEMTCPYRAV